MLREVLKQMIPFFVLLVVLWLVAELLERTMTDSGHTVVAPAKTAPSSP
ncbi:hypothetical protein P0Y35_04305 [Kiritimatiellaeota bacterium B1221]|nr:hypothetical protein [Kiritimatiellaeota bacterium B1221]